VCADIDDNAVTGGSSNGDRIVFLFDGSPATPPRIPQSSAQALSDANHGMPVAGDIGGVVFGSDCAGPPPPSPPALGVVTHDLTADQSTIYFFDPMTLERQSRELVGEQGVQYRRGFDVHETGIGVVVKTSTVAQARILDGQTGDVLTVMVEDPTLIEASGDACSQTDCLMAPLVGGIRVYNIATGQTTDIGNIGSGPSFASLDRFFFSSGFPSRWSTATVDGQNVQLVAGLEGRNVFDFSVCPDGSGAVMTEQNEAGEQHLFYMDLRIEGDGVTTFSGAVDMGFPGQSSAGTCLEGRGSESVPNAAGLILEDGRLTAGALIRGIGFRFLDVPQPTTPFSTFLTPRLGFSPPGGG